QPDRPGAGDEDALLDAPCHAANPIYGPNVAARTHQCG
ncbi:MAG: hypothetical protein QOG38_1954, partial [Hyphomicrobiales bacterium]|nr:hypothetical protein [Hyphomicrobiales bacterium]